MVVKRNTDYLDLNGRVSIRIPLVVRKRIEHVAQFENTTITEVIRVGIIEQFKEIL